MSQPITVWLTTSDPDSWKVITILEELTVPYKIKPLSLNEVKQAPFTIINPTGSVPAIHDPNTNLTLWQSNSIIQYLITTYDTHHLLTYDTLPETHLLNQYLHFQGSTQGPNFENCGLFSIHHPTHLPSAIAHYTAEVHRTLGALNTILEKRDWLVGEKCTYVDLAFLPWNAQVKTLVPDTAEEAKSYPWVERWQERMEGREAWRRVLKIYTDLLGNDVEKDGPYQSAVTPLRPLKSGTKRSHTIL
ncbi:glutathione transferase [Aspergillus heteromorphus CBS 117.55]|uniref:glutathione transferase n=1 Tax=Aspergillus heteromorphus CBS 117.55 TaxID=1448321 RepID=A0A317WUR9_9EURO|nr:glutathione transferase [Aspergillus heteromorphus CBS 117.55]PWY89825.1 glutathione transferase [Aspergillus heteromorphus CBS 117.55]